MAKIEGLTPISAPEGRRKVEGVTPIPGAEKGAESALRRSKL